MVKVSVSEFIRNYSSKQSSRTQRKIFRLLLVACSAFVTLVTLESNPKSALASPTTKGEELFLPTEYGQSSLGSTVVSDKDFFNLLPSNNLVNKFENFTNPDFFIPTNLTFPDELAGAAEIEKSSSISSSSTFELSQRGTFPDLQNHWAQAFVESLAVRNILAGFPDGTFRPNAPVTRAQYAAIISQAFNKTPVRPGLNFVDVPANYWGQEAIQEAYRTGFLTGYPNQVFRPDQNIPRVQALISLASGLDLNDSPTIALGDFYQDAAQIPDFAVSGIRTASNEGIVVNYPNVNLLNPNQLATRADVAAFIYQALVKEGQLPALAPSVTATNYIVGYDRETAQIPTTPTTPSPFSNLNREELLKRLLIPDPDTEEVVVVANRGVPSIGLNVPTGFGANFGQAFVGVGYQAETRPIPPSTQKGRDDAAFAVGFGLGNARENVGLEVVYTSFSTVRGGGPFETGGVSLKLHRRIGRTASAAVGVENVFNYGGSDGDTSYYGAVTNIFRLRNNDTDLFSSIAVTGGVGTGRFRAFQDVIDENDTVNVFGSVGLRVAEPISLVAAYTGQTLSVGASIAPFRNIPLVITPAVTDLTGRGTDQPRFVISVGYGFRLF